MHNVASGIDENGNDMAEEFANEVACFKLTGLSEKKPDKTLAPLSRVTEYTDGKQRAIRIQDLAAFDGTKLDIDRPIPEDPASDHKVLIVRPSTEKRVAHIDLLKNCKNPVRIADPPETLPSTHDAVPAEPPADSSTRVQVIYGYPAKIAMAQSLFRLIFALSSAHPMASLSFCLVAAVRSSCRSSCRSLRGTPSRKIVDVQRPGP